MKRAQTLSKLVVIVGPTAVGKSALAVRLARKFRGEVISADSRQVYRGLDIGTGKITKKEMRGVPHHLLDVASPARQYSVARYVRDARRAISDIWRRGDLPIICGGAGLYIDALLGTVHFPSVPPNPVLRKRLERETPEELFAILRKLDDERAKTIDAFNPRRLVRAIEIATALGKVPAHQNAPHKNIKPLFIGLMLRKDKLREKITARLSARIRAGMIAEVSALHRQGLSWKRMEELGLEYRCVSRYLCGYISKREMLEKLQSESLRYAKRQMTWFKRNKKIKWFSPVEFPKIAREVTNFLKS